MQLLQKFIVCYGILRISSWALIAYGWYGKCTEAEQKGLVGWYEPVGDYNIKTGVTEIGYEQLDWVYVLE